PLSGVLTPSDIARAVGDPMVLFLMGGFILATALEKNNVHQRIALTMVNLFGGQSSRQLVFGFMLASAFLSMWISNTATALMLLPVAMAVISKSKDPKLATPLLIGIAYAASIGGVGTPIGTPPNAVAMKYLVGENAISFSEWMMFGIPSALMLLVITWLLLIMLNPPKDKHMDLVIEGSFMSSWKAWVVYLIFASTILLWLTGKLHGLNSYIVAMLPVFVFLATRILGKDDLKLLSWDVLWLISGGIALGYGLEETGLSRVMIEQVPFSQLDPMLIVISATVLALLMSTFISNTATANLLLPLMAALGSSEAGLQALGGEMMLILVVTFSCSFAMALPVSTPPNAMAFATGLLPSSVLLRMGAIVSVIGLGCAYLMGWVLKQVGFY
ncbi:MAG: DASS family sodium-coupled anion symporter, partial [SAR324 cluster bacterium]|nr:DASS family sodium-coupled anion symporter [SAR324 cluster bacterium]